jgi:hypothetical protein
MYAACARCATGREKLACFDAMMFVEHKCVGMMRDGASINDSLTVTSQAGSRIISLNNRYVAE